LDDLDSIKQPSTCLSWRYRIYIPVFTFTIALVIFLWSRNAQLSSPPGCRQHEATWTDCGSSPEEARANKCHYEPMLGAWIPHGCYIDEPASYDNPFTNRIWYRDSNLTQPIDIDSLMAGNEIEIWTPFFHEEHCIYCWRRLAAAVEQRVPLIDSVSHNIGHSTHCAKAINQLLVGLSNDSIPLSLLHDEPKVYLTQVLLQYAKCKPLFDNCE